MEREGEEETEKAMLVYLCGFPHTPWLVSTPAPGIAFASTYSLLLLGEGVSFLWKVPITYLLHYPPLQNQGCLDFLDCHPE